LQVRVGRRQQPHQLGSLRRAQRVDPVGGQPGAPAVDRDLGQVARGPGRPNRRLRDLIHHGKATPSMIISHELSLEEAPDAYKHFDNRDMGWTKVILHPNAA